MKKGRYCPNPPYFPILYSFLKNWLPKQWFQLRTGLDKQLYVTVWKHHLIIFKRYKLIQWSGNEDVIANTDFVTGNDAKMIWVDKAFSALQVGYYIFQRPMKACFIEKTHTTIVPMAQLSFFLPSCSTENTELCLFNTCYLLAVIADKNKAQEVPVFTMAHVLFCWDMQRSRLSTVITTCHAHQLFSDSHN